jgi:PAS domain S-box-containing protein
VLQRSHLELERQVAARTAALSQANSVLQEQIAERQQVEVALRQREQELQALLNNTPDVIIRCDRQLRFVYVNPAVERTTGMPASFFLGRTSQEHGTPPDLCRLWDETMQQVFATAQEQAIEFQVPNPQGCRSFQSRVVPEFNLQGEVEHVLIVSRDITEIKQAEAERLQLIWAKAAQAEAEIAQQRANFLAEVSAQLATSLDYQTMLQQVAYLMVPRLADYCIIFITEAGTGQLRRVAAAHIDPTKVDTVLELEQHYCFDIHADHPVAHVVCTRQPICRTSLPADWALAINAPPAYQEALQSLHAHAYMIEPLVARDRTLGALLFALSDPRRSYSAEEVGLAAEVAHRAAIAIDNVRLYQEAQAARTASEAASRTKDEFLTVLSHELRTPLNSILGWSQMLNTRQLEPTTVTRALETIERNARHQAQLVEDILEVSRMTQGKLQLRIALTQLPTIVTAAIDVMQPAIAAKGIHLNLNFDTGTAEVAGDPDRLQQVVWNLLSNAVKFTPEGGQVTIALQEIGNQVQLEITDTGAGIAPEFLPYVFERFRQADSSTTREHGGLGLGLAIARYLIELHGGKISAFSSGVGQGATFVVQLPLAQTHSYAVAPATHSLTPPTPPPS